MKTPARLPKPFLDASGKDDYLNKAVTQGEVFTIDDALAMVDIHRSMNCPYYSECLIFVVKNGWLGWSCTRCVHHDPKL